MVKMNNYTVLSILVVLSLGLNPAIAQNTYPTSGNVILDGYNLVVKSPYTTGGWARGMLFQDENGTVTYGGIGLLGTGVNHTINSLYMAHGASPYNSGLGLYILPNGSVGIGTTTPSNALELVTDENTIAIVKTTSTNNSAGIRLQGRRPNSNNYSSHSINTEGTGHYTLTVNADEVLRLKTNGRDALVVNDVQNIGIGTSSAGEKLEVNGKIRSKEIIVEAESWPDYVFEADYELMSIAELEQFIKENKHLPEVPNAKQIMNEGAHLGEINTLLLKKIEELTLHTISIKNDYEQKIAKQTELISV